MSARLSVAFPAACSGDMYAAVPRMTPTLVIIAGDVIVGDMVAAGLLRRRVHRFGEAEVEHLHNAVAGDLDIRWFEISVNNSLLVRGFESLGDLLAMGSASSSGTHHRRCGRRVSGPPLTP